MTMVDGMTFPQSSTGERTQKEHAIYYWQRSSIIRGSANDSGDEEIMITENGLRHFPVFETQPSIEFVEGWMEDLNSTGHPELYERVSTTKPQTIGSLRLLSGEIKVPVFKRKEQDLVPCPICHPTEPWFRIGRMAWFPEERVVRFIGHDCAKRHYQGEFDVAEKRYRKEARLRHLQRRWNEIAPNAGRLMNAAAALSEIAKALEDVRAEIDQKARGLSKFFGTELSRNSGRIEIKVDTGVKDNQGNAVIGTEVLGTTMGTQFWGRPFVPYQQLLTLMRDIDDLSHPLPTLRSEELDAQHEAEILERGASADALPDRLDDLNLLLFWSQKFFEPENLALLERWGKNAGSPFQSLVCRFDDGRLVIASNSFVAYHYANPQVPDEALVRPPRLSSEILNLRRPMARNR